MCKLRMFVGELVYGVCVWVKSGMMYMSLLVCVRGCGCVFGWVLEQAIRDTLSHGDKHQ